MRALRSLTLVLALIAVGYIPIQTQAPDANAVLAAARKALGGETRLAGVKSLIATGRTRQVRGDNLVPIEFEIAFEAPAKYVRKDEIPAQETGITSLGFNGDELIQLPPPPTPPPPPATPGGGRPAGPDPEAARRARVNTLKQDLARLMLGLFAGSYEGFPLTFTYVAQAEAPQGKADVLEAKGPGNFTARLFVHRDTHLPIMVSWTAPTGRGQPPPRGGGPGAMVPPEARGNTPASPPPPGAAPPPAAAPPTAQGAQPPPPGMPMPPPGARGAGPAGPPVENRLYFAEHRDVDGLQLPFRIRRASGPDTIEETTFDRFRVNPKIDPKKFEVRK